MSSYFYLSVRTLLLILLIEASEMNYEAIFIFSSFDAFTFIVISLGIAFLSLLYKNYTKHFTIFYPLFEVETLTLV